jgi:hypothetical protein
MQAVLLQTDIKSDLKLLIELALKLGVNVKTLSNEEIEDLSIENAIKTGATNEFIDIDNYLIKLNNEIKN